MEEILVKTLKIYGPMEVKSKNASKDIHCIKFIRKPQLFVGVNGLCLILKSNRRRIKSLIHMDRIIPYLGDKYFIGVTWIETKMNVSFEFESKEEEESYANIIAMMKKHVETFKPAPNRIPPW